MHWALSPPAPYDPVNRLKSVEDPLGHLTTFSYDLAGNRTVSQKSAGICDHQRLRRIESAQRGRHSLGRADDDNLRCGGAS